METKWTPGPWKVSKTGPCGIYADETRYICGTNTEGTQEENRANARRIVACVNYCEGVSTAEIEAAPKHLTLRGLLAFLDIDAPKINDNLSNGSRSGGSRE